MERRYLWMPSELRANGIRLGLMTEGTYASFLEEAQLKGREAGQKIPALGLTLEFKPGMSPTGSDQTYPISAAEWEAFLADIPTYCRSTPEVYAFDSDQFVLPI